MAATVFASSAMNRPQPGGSAGFGPSCLIYDPLGPLGILSNYAITPFEIGGETWPSVEHFFQAAKFRRQEDRSLVRLAPRAADAKDLAWGQLSDRVRPDWDHVRTAVMNEALRAKFEQYGAARDILLATWPMPLIENSPTDAFWGIGPDGLGRDKFGRSLEGVRAALVGRTSPLAIKRPVAGASRGGHSRVEFVELDCNKALARSVADAPELVFKSFQHMAVDQLMLSEALSLGVPPSWTVAPAEDRGISELQNLHDTIVLHYGGPDQFYQVLGQIFDQKYANYTWHQDARCGVFDWVRQFRGILASILGGKCATGRILAVGAGAGNEAGQVWSAFDARVTLSEIGARLLHNCRTEAPEARVIRNRAESLKDVPDASQDLYCALRVYESVFFDIPRSLTEAARVLKPGGSIIISVSNGYLTPHGSIVRGQIGKNGQLDSLAPWLKIMEIASLTRSIGFQYWQFHDLQSELALSAIFEK
jgi:hypothetical protein